MAASTTDYYDLVELRYPGLIREIRDLIRKSEIQFEGGSSDRESFLWEHTTHVASLVCRLARAQKSNPLVPVLTALFHDAGKFSGGSYHEDETAEEEEAARIAAPILHRRGVKAVQVRRIFSGLKALYNEKAGKNTAADLVHDADFLSKFGALGVAAFFTKSALRGRTVGSAILGQLSKEWTYAACLPMNMRTAVGRKLAAKRSAESLRFYRRLLAELRDAGIADLAVRRIRIPHPFQRAQTVDVHLVAARRCPECDGRWQTDWFIEQGIKCRSLTIDCICRECGKRWETSFCLPELRADGSKRRRR